jgi:tyrosyl-tRNA synthetase
MDLVKELTWRGLIHDIMPGTEALLSKEMVTGYVGFDPTADSLHIGNMVPIMLLVHLQRAGHRPLALVGGATGMIGDPSGKNKERSLLDLEVMNHNLNCQKEQLQKFLNFDCGDNSAKVVNNYDWFKEMNFLEFIRDTGKHITVNYMMSKDSVKNRLEGEGMSFTEFTYQLIQGYDFYHLHTAENCKLQMGGSDQWGNIVTGSELIRRKGKSEGFALTAPLVKKADGTKFGKSEGGNIWLDAKKTSPYKFYQYWLNAADADAENFIKVFTLLDQETIEKLIAEHNEAPHLRVLQKRLAEEVTRTVHSQEALDRAIEASNILFDKKANKESLQRLHEDDFLSVFEGVGSGNVDGANEQNIVDVLVDSGFLKSKGEARRALKENSISVNKEKVTEEFTLTADDVLNEKYVLLQRGKKNYFILHGA